MKDFIKVLMVGAGAILLTALSVLAILFIIFAALIGLHATLFS